MSEQKTLNEAPVIPSPKKDPEIGVDTSNTFNAEVLDAALTNSLDLNSINSLVQSAQNREQAYELIDAMSQDDVISAVLETYAEDTIQTNDKGQAVWVESDNGQVLDYVKWLLDSINVDKHIYQWVYCLVTYGDVYIRLFRESDVKEDSLFKKPEGKNKLLNEAINHTYGRSEELREDVNLKVYTPDDRYVPFVQMVDNPGEMFDLQKFGKTYGYIKAPIRVIQQQTSDQMYNYLTNYNMKKSDVELYDGTCFVHACLENTNQRQPETVNIFLDDADNENTDSMYASYSVKRGQSILYNTFRIWRELNLLELSALMNRLTKSALVRILSIDIGDMPKEQVQPFLSRLKEKIEQKSAIDTGKSMQDYTAAGPIDNTIYIPKHGEQGNITATTIGGDFDPKSLVDIEYFRDKLFGSLKVPKQMFGQTGDSTGFNAGSSLTIISSRYGKTIKRLQSVMCELITDIVNLFLIDRGMTNYVNKFRIRMQTPVTQEEIDKRSNTDNRLKYIGDVMQQLNDVEDKTIKLKIYKSLLVDVVNDSQVITYLEDYIKKLEEAEKPKTKDADSFAKNEEQSVDINVEETSNTELPNLDQLQVSTEESFDDTDASKEVLLEEQKDKEDDSYLPSAFDLNLDLTKKDI